MGMVLTTKGLIERERLTVKETITETANSRDIFTEWFLDGEMVRSDLAVSILSGHALFAEKEDI